MFNQTDFNNFIIKNKIISLSEKAFTLKSGQKSHLYINWRDITNDVALLETCAHYIIKFCETHTLKPDCFYGVPEGATKIGILTQYLWSKKQGCSPGSHKLSMGRVKPKEHGSPSDRFFVGEPEGNIILIEDVTTTGQSMLKTLDQLQALNKKVIACLGLTNRESKQLNKTIANEVADRNTTYIYLSQAKELLVNITSEKNSKLIQQELENL
ncbi:hypothetical protein DID74_02650 [Candidatus Marinamargulisbacteria bacterium SCGC AG-333-B06]|nr:hypothetical protein DID74_02650 [Candidatus Marinamargulisbacteria bacterium SCGC AG-333-B06]